MCSFMPRLYPHLKKMMMKKMFMVPVHATQFQSYDDNETKRGLSNA